jgi:hypothetical protein
LRILQIGNIVGDGRVPDRFKADQNCPRSIARVRIDRDVL